MRLQNLRDLEIYKHAVDGGSLRAAARALNLSPAVVSRRIASLEASLNATLLLRSTRSLQVTPRGEQFYRRCVAILDQIHKAESELGSKPELEGAVRVSVPTAFATARNLKALGTILDANPMLDVELYLSDQPVDPRAAGLDVVVHPGIQSDSTLLTRRLGTARVLIVATPAYLDRWGRPATPADLLNHRCLRFRSDRQQDTWRLIDNNGCVEEVRVGGTFFCDNSAALGVALYAGLGIGFREINEASDAVEQGVLEHVLPAYHSPPFGVYATYPRENSGSRPVSALLTMISELLDQATQGIGI